MAVTLGAEVALSLHLDNSATYGELENAIMEAGFTNYTIMRTVNPDGSGDAQLYVRSDLGADGNPQSLPAGDTLQKLTDAIESLQTTVDEPS